MKFFTYSTHTGINFYESAEEAKKKAEEAISFYNDDGWDEDVTSVCWGEVREGAEICDIKQREDFGSEEWDDMGGGDFDCICNYELKPICEFMPPESISSICRKTHFQTCLICEDATCCDNANPSINALKDEVAKWKEKYYGLRRL